MTSRTRLLALLVAGLVACDSDSVHAPPSPAATIPELGPVRGEPREVIVIGTVRDADRGTPIPFAVAKLDQRVVQSDANGQFVFTERVEGTDPVLRGSLSVRAIGFSRVERELLIAPQDTVRLDVEMKKDVLCLCEIAVPDPSTPRR